MSPISVSYFTTIKRNILSERLFFSELSHHVLNININRFWRFGKLSYIGGKPRKDNNNSKFTTITPKEKNKPGRGTKKTPVIGIKDRGTGRVYARVALPNEEGKNWLVNNFCL